MPWHRRHSASGARGFDPKPPKERVQNARAIVMDGTNPAASGTDAALSGDLIDLVAKDCPLDLPDDPLPILEAQPEPLWAGDTVRSRYAIKLVSAFLPIVEGCFDQNPDAHGSPSQRTHLSTGEGNDEDPHVLSTPKRERVMQGFRSRGGLQRFVSMQSAARNCFSVPARRRSALNIRYHRLEAFEAWKSAANAA